MTPDELSVLIKEEARSCGFDLCGIASSDYLQAEASRLRLWLDYRCNGGMKFFLRNSDKRVDPSLLFPGAKSVIVLALNYFADTADRGEQLPVISRYAAGRDYHLVIKEKLRKMLDSLTCKVPGLQGRVFTDSAPLMEKALAVRAGLGSQGRNSLLIVKDKGSWFFLGEILIDQTASPDKPCVADLCGSCRRCIDACPTNAITEEGYIDARKCISYLTVEHEGDISEEYAGKLNGIVYGCDICQDVCPHNSKAIPHNVPDFNTPARRLGMTSYDLLSLSPAAFMEIFSNTAIERIGYRRFMRNIRFSLADGSGSPEA
jgi:epoxyqueuosine reductase